MKIVVIGATGNIGRRISQEALSCGHEVVGVVRDPAAVQPPDPRVRLVKGDATRAEDVARVVRVPTRR
jgi:putative NADH-flavin reductase